MSELVKWLRQAARKEAKKHFQKDPSPHALWQAADRIEELERCLQPLLEHYLACYDGNYDQLATDARAVLEKKS